MYKKPYMGIQEIHDSSCFSFLASTCHSVESHINFKNDHANAKQVHNEWENGHDNGTNAIDGMIAKNNMEANVRKANFELGED